MFPLSRPGADAGGQRLLATPEFVEAFLNYCKLGQQDGAIARGAATHVVAQVDEDDRTLAFMDWVGNKGHDVRLPYNYLSKAEWTAVF